MRKDRRGIETSMLLRLIIAGVFLLVMLGVIIIWVKSGNGPSSICEKTNWFFGGCT